MSRNDAKFIHFCVNVEGMIANLKNSRRNDSPLKTDDGRPVSRVEAIAWLRNQRDMGRRVLPMGECEGFDYQTGCPGHDTEPQEGEG